MKRNILKGAFWVLLSISTVSCSDFLDINPHDSISDAAVWENMDLAEAFLNNCYTYVEGENENGAAAQRQKAGGEFCHRVRQRAQLEDHEGRGGPGAGLCGGGAGKRRHDGGGGPALCGRESVLR